MYGAKTTPHMYVIDKNGKLVYAGAIDDKASTDLEDVKEAKTMFQTRWMNYLQERMLVFKVQHLMGAV